MQSVAVRLIVDREREIEAFKPEEYWKITALLAPDRRSAASRRPSSRSQAAKTKKRPKPKTAKPRTKPTAEKPLPEGAFLAELAEWAGEKFEADNQEQADAIVTALDGAAYVVSKVEQKDRQEKAAAAVHHQHACSSRPASACASPPSGP